MLRAQSALLIGTAVAVMLATCGASLAHGENLEGLTVTDLDGREVRPFASGPDAARAVVFVFTRSDCPIANRYAPDLQRLQQQAAAAADRFLDRVRRPRRERPRYS